ncbi:MAG TPA: UxaA family hydrolase [Terriglobales bacterium]|nr:UxaA family hydrolase [Terriglobales bacterium]
MIRGITMNPKDNVCVIVDEAGAKAGGQVQVGDRVITAGADIPMPHKMAIRDIGKGEEIIKYGFYIGYAAEDIKTGDYVHIHNLRT